MKEGDPKSIVDTRPKGGYDAGHIPGSTNIPFSEFYADDGTFKSAADLKAIFATAGVDLEKPTHFSCGGGVAATVGRAAAIAAGATGKASIYDGSWGEYK